MSKKVTIQDIADSLGVSRNTVSKAINNSVGLADATREQILQKAFEMGYKQFYFAGIRKQMEPSTEEAVPVQGEIAVFTTRYLSYAHFSATMLDKFHMEISQLGYTMNMHWVTYENILNKSLPITVNWNNIKGILCLEMFDWDYSQMLCTLDVPVLFVDGPAQTKGRTLPADQLYMDNTSAITQFTNEMLERGNTRIGFVGQIHHCQSFYERYYAYYLAMTMAGHPVDEKYVINYPDTDQLLDYFVDHTDLPEVFICANDFVAMDTIQALARIGKRVPEDVQICGFDDCQEARFTKPRLTTVHIHTQIMAYSAAQLLISRIEQPSLDFRTVHTETELIYRDSTASG